MLTAYLTEGMSQIEVLIVMLAAHASKDELKRLSRFFNDFANAEAVMPGAG